MARNMVASALAVVIVVLSPAASAREVRTRGPFLLAALPSLGTVTWRCDPRGQPRIRRGLPALALGFRAFSSSADVQLRLRVGTRLVRSLRVDPGESVALPFVRGPLQRLELVQFTEAGTLRAFVRVEFVFPSVATYCYSYLPPRIDIQITPRH